MNPLVSTCITTYNRKELLPLTLKSVLNQTYKNTEVIIVDDHSTDGTKELVENELLNLDDRVRYIRHEENKSLATGRNTAIFNAKGKYFTFCDDDDEWEENFIEEFVKVAESYDDNWCFYCGCKYKNILGSTVSIVFDFKGDMEQHVKDGYTPPVASQFYSLESLKKVGGYNTDIKSGVDHDLWIRLAKIDIKIKSIPFALSIPNANAKQERMTTDYEKRINGIKNSLLIWKNDLEKIYGKEFYLNFYNAYLDRERLKFLNGYIRYFKYKQAWALKEDISAYKFVRMIIVSNMKVLSKFIIPKVFIAKEKQIILKPTLKIINEA